MRISETKVVQLIESDPPQLVIINEIDGSEISISVEEIDKLSFAIQYFGPHMHNQPAKIKRTNLYS
jgi:hypothetical protein